MASRLFFAREQIRKGFTPVTERVLNGYIIIVENQVIEAGYQLEKQM